MYKIRQIQYAAGSTSIQVYKIENRKRVIVLHIGTARSEQEKADLLSLAIDFIDRISKQSSLFAEKDSGNVLCLNQVEFIGVSYSFFYELIFKLIVKIGFDKLKNILLLDLVIIRIKTDNGYLNCSYSSVRYRKDKYEMEKQIEKAKYILSYPSKNKKLKFTKLSGQQLELNQKLIAKTQKLLGIKGYYTNLEESSASNQTVMERYHELYKIEQAFRISKSDLQTRPIFHFQEEPIKLHLLICFMALVVSEFAELQINRSIKNLHTNARKLPMQD